MAAFAVVRLQERGNRERFSFRGLFFLGGGGLFKLQDAKKTNGRMDFGKEGLHDYFQAKQALFKWHAIRSRESRLVFTVLSLVVHFRYCERDQQQIIARCYSSGNALTLR